MVNIKRNALWLNYLLIGIFAPFSILGIFSALWLNYFNGYFSSLFRFWKFFSHIDRG